MQNNNSGSRRQSAITVMKGEKCYVLDQQKKQKKRRWKISLKACEPRSAERKCQGCIWAEKEQGSLTMKDKKKLFEEMQAHLMSDDAPSVYLNQISESAIFKEYPFTYLSRLKEIPQSAKHHPEGNVWNHTMLVVDEAAEKKNSSREPIAFMWAALLHDIGKAETTDSSNGRVTAYDHDKAGALRADEFLSALIDERKLIRQIVSLIRWHMQILFVAKSMQFADIKNMLKETDTEEIALLGYCDRMGRLNADRKAENENLRIFMEKCRSVPAPR